MPATNGERTGTAVAREMAAPLVPRDWEGLRQEGAVEEQEDRWARLLPELLAEVLRRLEASGGERWPARKDVMSCAYVCRRWSDAADFFLFFSHFFSKIFTNMFLEV